MRWERGGGGVRRGGGQQFSVMEEHPTLYWASIAKRKCPISSQTTYPANHQESINVKIRGELSFFQSIRDVL